MSIRTMHHLGWKTSISSRVNSHLIHSIPGIRDDVCVKEKLTDEERNSEFSLDRCLYCCCCKQHTAALCSYVMFRITTDQWRSQYKQAHRRTNWNHCFFLTKNKKKTSTGRISDQWDIPNPRLHKNAHVISALCSVKSSVCGMCVKAEQIQKICQAELPSYTFTQEMSTLLSEGRKRKPITKQGRLNKNNEVPQASDYFVEKLLI